MTGEGIDFLKIINVYLSQNGKIDDEMYELLAKSYSALGKYDRTECIKILGDVFNDQKREFAKLLSVLTSISEGNIELYEVMAEVITDESFSVEEVYELIIQLNYRLFVMKGNIYAPLHKAYYYFLERCSKEMGLRYSYRPYNQRNKKRVILATEQLLSAYHAPTQLLVNLYYYLSKIGYDVTVLIANPGKIKTRDEIWTYKKIKKNSLFEESGRFTLEIMNTKISGYNIMLTSEELLLNIKQSIELIRSINPEFIINVGSLIVPTDILSKEMTIVSYPLINAIPVTPASIIMDLNHLDRSELYLIPNKNVQLIETQFTCTLKPIGADNQEEIELVNRLDGFKILLVGNRLDEEIDLAFLQWMYTLVFELSGIKFIIVGECDDIKKKVERMGSKESFIFTGYVDNLEGLMQVCDLYLNPPRTGGGFSAKLALQNHMPIVTGKEGDVAYTVGNAFICNSMDEMKQTISRYMQDTAFMEMQKKECEKRAIERYKNQEGGIEEMRHFCEKVENYIKQQELMGLS